MDGGTRESHVEQIVIQEVRLGLGVDEYQCARGRHGQKEIVETFLLQTVFGVDDLAKRSLSICFNRGLLVGNLRSDPR